MHQFDKSTQLQPRSGLGWGAPAFPTPAIETIGLGLEIGIGLGLGLGLVSVMVRDSGCRNSGYRNNGCRNCGMYTDRMAFDTFLSDMISDTVVTGQLADSPTRRQIK